MRFEEVDTKLRKFETVHDLCVSPQIYIVTRLDGRGFTKKTKEMWNLEAPFDIRFHKAMVDTTEYLMKCGFNIIYGYTQSDEISLLFHFNEDIFRRKIRKINSVLAGEASAFFSLEMNSIASFDCRISQLPNSQLVQEYFRWRQEDAHRNSLNAHCYWLLRQQGNTATKATSFLSEKGINEKNQLLLDHNINFNDLPKWQKRGTALYWNQIIKQGFNPKTGQNVETTRRQIIQDNSLLVGDEYSQFINKFL